MVGLPEYDRARIGWWLLALVLGSAVVLILSGFVGALVLGVFVYYATRPIYRRIEGRVRPRTLAAIAALFLIAMPVLVLIAYTTAIAIAELSSVTGADLDAFQDVLRPYVDLPLSSLDPQELLTRLIEQPGRLGSLGSPEAISGALSVAGAYAGAFVSGLLQVFIALVVAFYLLRDDHRLTAWVREAFGTNRTASAYAVAVDRDLQTIYFGNILNAFVVAVVAAVSYNALDLLAPAGISIPAPTLLGLLTGAASLVPVVGMKLVYVPIGLYLAAVSLADGGRLLWFPILYFLVVVVLVDGATEILLRPYISGRNLHVGMVLFAYILGPVFFGWYGLFLGPLLLVLVVHLARIVLPELIRGTPLEPGAIGDDPIPDSDGPFVAETDSGIGGKADSNVERGVDSNVEGKAHSRPEGNTPPERDEPGSTAGAGGDADGAARNEES